eukprot:1463331-Pyramimonas_sp.AAC.1
MAKDRTMCSCEYCNSESVFRWRSLWGHETCERCAAICGRETYGPCHGSLRWSSLWGHEAYDGCAELGGGEA